MSTFRLYYWVSIGSSGRGSIIAVGTDGEAAIDEPICRTQHFNIADPNDCL